MRYTIQGKEVTMYDVSALLLYKLVTKAEEIGSSYGSRQVEVFLSGHFFLQSASGEREVELQRFPVTAYAPFPVLHFPIINSKEEKLAVLAKFQQLSGPYYGNIAPVSSKSEAYAARDYDYPCVLFFFTDADDAQHFSSVVEQAQRFENALVAFVHDVSWQQHKALLTATHVFFEEIEEQRLGGVCRAFYEQRRARKGEAG